MKSYLTQLYDYNRWANGLFVDALTQSDYQNEKIDGFFSHIAAAQMTWLSRMQSVEMRVPGVFERMAHEETCDLLNYSNEQYLSLIAACEDFDRLISYKTTEGVEHSNPLINLLTHVANHSTHHRSQIALLLREEGITPPASDFIFYLRAKT